jgi:hypothetical protein
MANDLHNTRWLRSRPTQGGFTADKIDAEAGIIRDVVMVQEGEAKGHEVHLDGEFINDIVAYDNHNFSKTGLKGRFGHPGASSETMGTQLGIFRNFRKREQDGKAQAIADLHLLESSELSPSHPGMKSWVLKMAEEQPDFMMSSIVFRGDGYYQRDPEGKKHKLQIAYSEMEGRYFKGYKEEYGNIYISMGEHFYTDLVEAGAATENLFSNQVNPHLFVAQADQFLYDHPELKTFIQAHPDKVTAFFATLGIRLTGQTTEVAPTPPIQMPTPSFNFFKWLSGESEAEATDIETIRTELNTAQKDVMALKAEKETAENRVAELKEGNDTLQSAVGELEEQLSKATARIEELEAKPAALHTGGPTEASTSAPEKGQKTKELYERYGIK